MKSFAHQEQAFNAAAEKDDFAFLMDMGTGKSKVLIDNAAFLAAQHKIDRVLVVAPKSVHLQWVEEQLEKHWPAAIPYSACAQSDKKKPDWWGEWPQNMGRVLWVTVNFDALLNAQTRKTLQSFLRAGKSMMVVDESQKIKNPQASRSKACADLGRDADYRRILTGSPVAKGIEDYYSQFRFLNPDIIGLRSMAGFKRQFCIMGGFENRQIIGYREADKFHALIAPYSFRVEKSEVLDLPPKMYDTRRIDLNPRQRTVYNELKRELVTELSDGTQISVGEAIQRMLRLQQVVQGYLPMESGGFEDLGAEERLRALDDILDGAAGKLVVWCRFTRDIDLIMERYKGKSVRFDGQMGKAEREQSKERFLNETDIRLFVGNAQAGGTGLDGLQHVSDTVCYYSNSFSSLDRWQSEDRTHRIGTKGTVTYYDIIARNTIDSAILANLRRKKDISSMSLSELKSMIGGEA